MTNGHPYREEDFDLYALGVLEGDERSGIESHIASCPDCTRKLAEARGRIALLSLSVPPQEPPLAVRQRLLAQIRAYQIAERKPSFAPEDRPPARWWNVAWTFAALALAIVTVFLWIQTNRLQSELEHQREIARQQVEANARARDIAALLTSPQTITVSLDPKSPNATEPGRVFYNERQGALIYEGILPQIASDKSYELWVIPQTGNPVPAGVFSPKPNGEAEVVLPKIPAGISPKAFAVTVEPAGGKDQPTGPMAQVGLGHQSL